MYSQDPPLHTELGATDRCCITFGIAETEAHTVADSLEAIYARLSQEIAILAQQDLQRVTPLFWNMRFGDAPAFYNYYAVTFFDIRSCTQEERWRLQAILIDMNIPYYIQKRLLLVIYAEGIELENFRLRIFQEQIKIPFGKEEGSLQCSFVVGASNNHWTVDFDTAGSDRHEAFQIEDDGSLIKSDGLVDPGFSKELNNVLGAIQIRLAIVHVQDKGHQKVVAFIAAPNVLPQIPGIFIDHKARKRVVHYKQPDVHTTERTSNIYVKETKTDHHVGAHNKGLCQGARLSGFFPLPGNGMSRRRFGQLQVFSFEIGNRDIAVDMLDEIAPICLIEAELSMQEVLQLFDILMRQKHLLDHHTIFLECTMSKPPPDQYDKEVITTLPDHECIVHCRIEKGQKLQVLQPRFERGKVSRCVSNALELSVYVRSDLLLFLPGQVEVQDIFGSAPFGRVLSIWHNNQKASESHVSRSTTAKFVTKATSNTPKTGQNAKKDFSLTVEVADDKHSPTRSVPSSSDHNQDAVSPLPTELDVTGTISQEENISPKNMANLSGEVNKAMQVDESNDLRTASEDANFDRPATTDNSQRSPKVDTEIAKESSPPQDNAVILVSPEEDPSGKGASQCSSDSMFCERVCQELQQQLEDAQAKDKECQNLSPKRAGLTKEIPEAKKPSNCSRLAHFACRRGRKTTWRRLYAARNAFKDCHAFDAPWWLHCIPPDGTDWMVPHENSTSGVCTALGRPQLQQLPVSIKYVCTVASTPALKSSGHRALAMVEDPHVSMWLPRERREIVCHASPLLEKCSSRWNCRVLQQLFFVGKSSTFGLSLILYTKTPTNAWLTQFGNTLRDNNCFWQFVSLSWKRNTRGS